MTDHLRRISEHMALESKALQLEAERARLFDHTTNRGTEAEHSIIKWLRARLAPDYSVSSGELIDSYDTNSDLKSRQQDGIIHRTSAEASRFLLPSGMRLVPIETAAAVVEVKLRLDHAEFKKADAAATETARLRLRPHWLGNILDSATAGSKCFTSMSEEDRRLGVPTTSEAFGAPPTTFTIFAFDGVQDADTIRQWMAKSTVSVVCCLAAGCVVRRTRVVPDSDGVDPSDDGVDVSAHDALWHFAEAVHAITKRHELILKHFQPDFSGYARYPKTFHATTSDSVSVTDSCEAELIR